LLLAYALLSHPEIQPGPVVESRAAIAEVEQSTNINGLHGPVTAGSGQGANSADGDSFSSNLPSGTAGADHQSSDAATLAPQAGEHAVETRTGDSITATDAADALANEPATSVAPGVPADQPFSLPVPGSASIPLAFQQLPAGFAAANPQVADALRGLQQQFVAAVGGGPDQNPNDPAYYQRWVGAEADIDEQYHLLVGDSLFLLNQIQVNSNATASSAK
jgi:hypothetical protein